MLSAEVDAVAVETGIVDTPGFSVVHEGTSTVLRHRPAKACARIAPRHRTRAETAHTLHIVATLVAQDAAVLPPSHPAPVPLPSGRHVTFWPLASRPTNASMTNQKMADAILSVHKTTRARRSATPTRHTQHITPLAPRLIAHPQARVRIWLCRHQTNEPTTRCGNWHTTAESADAAT